MYTWMDEKDDERDAEFRMMFGPGPTEEELDKKYQYNLEKYHKNGYNFELIKEGKRYSKFIVNKKYDIYISVSDRGDYLGTDNYEFYHKHYSYKKYGKESYSLLPFIKLLAKTGGRKEYSKLSEKEKDEFVERAYQEYEEYLKICDQYFIYLQLLINWIKNEKDDLIKIGTGINWRTGHPNFQVYLDKNSLRIDTKKIGLDHSDESVDVFGKIYMAKNRKELESGKYESDNRYEICYKRITYYHDIEFTHGIFKSELYKKIEELFKYISDYC